MERVLIVAKTHMRNGACVGGLTRNSNRNIRLLTAQRSHQPSDTPFEVGQVWELGYRSFSGRTPPHIEDVIVTSQTYIAPQPDVYKTLLERVRPWKGGPQALFDGRLNLTERGSYIARSTGVPSCSAGFWLPERPLMVARVDDRVYYQIEYEATDGGNIEQRTLSMRYVGFAEPISVIPANALVRVSLARWWRPTDKDEERCYLQLSGWFL